MPTKKATPPVVRLGHPMAFMAFLRHVGAPVDHYLRRSGLPVLANDPNTFVPLLRVWSFFDTAARHEDPMVGWHAGAYVGDKSLNAGLLRKLETKSTLLQALHELVQMARSEASDIHLGVHERRHDVLFYTHYPGFAQEPGYMISQVYQLQVVLDLIRCFVGRHWSPHVIGIEDATVPTIAEQYFPGSQLLTQQKSGYILIPRTYLHWGPRRTGLNIPGSHVSAVRERLDYCNMLRAVLRSYLSEGYPSERFAAELMGTSVRTLSRRLAASGLTYKTLIDQLRFIRAKECLHDSDMRIVDVARSVGFEDQGDFTRMFRRIGGLTPTQYRRSIVS